jgi:single-strand DNA-binding protein
MAGLNKISLIGHLGRDPELREYQGNKVASFSLAVTEKYMDRENKLVEKTEWFNVSFWGNVSDVVMKYLKKGNQVYVDGKLSTREYLDKEGKNRVGLEVRGQNITLLGSASDSQNQGTKNHNPSPAQQNTPKQPEAMSDFTPSEEQGDDLPF